MDNASYIANRIEKFKLYGNSLPKAKVYYRKDWDTNYFDLFGKQFGMMSVEPSEHSIITLKGPPETNEELREMYADIIPGYYANKKHWNSIKLNTKELNDDEIEKMIKVSYELVLSNLPLKIRKQM